MTYTHELKPRFQTLDLAYIGIGAALIAVCSWISIPTAVPFTLQTFAVFFILTLLGGKRGTLSVLVYTLLGAAGLPVFAGFSGGIGIILGSTGGYILGFMLMGLVFWLAEMLFGDKTPVKIAAHILGLALCYAFGTVWFMIVYARTNDPVGLAAVLSWCVFPFIIPDLIKMAMAFFIAKRIAPVISK